jgi:transposase
MMGVPLPDSTQYDKIEDVTNAGYPAFNYLGKLAANGHLAHGDDTAVRIKSVIKTNTTENNKARTGTFKKGIISFNGKNKIHLFYSSRKHCGENMLSLLEKRDPNLPEIKYMCDALSSIKAILIVSGKEYHLEYKNLGAF